MTDRDDETGPRRKKRGSHRYGTWSIARRGESYCVRMSVAGKRYTFSVATTDRAEAEHFAKTKRRELDRTAERRSSGLPDSIRVSELFELFERDELPGLAAGTRRTYRDSLKPIRTYFVEQLEDPPLVQVHAKHVSAFLTWRRTHRLDGTDPVSNRTRQKDRAVLHRIFALAERLEYREGNPVSRVEPPKADTRDPVILSSDEYERLLTACVERPMVALFVLVLGESGARSESEVLYIQWEHLDLEKGFLWIDSTRQGHRTKSGKGRWVPMTERLRAALRDHAAAFRLATYDDARSPWVFHHLTSRRHHTAGERVGSFRRAFENASKRAKLPPAFHQHDLRHRRVTTWLAEGKNPVHVKEALGHADLRTTMGYTHLSREHLKALVEEGPRQPARGRKKG